MSKEPLFTEFVNELQMELQYHLNGGTSYRQVISALSLVIALEMKEIEPFRDRELAVQTVAKLFPSLPGEKIFDAGKFLNIIYKDLYLKLNVNDEVKKYVQEKKNNRKVGGNHGFKS